MVLAHRRRCGCPSGMGRIGQRVGEVVGQVGEPTDRLQARPARRVRRCRSSLSSTGQIIRSGPCPSTQLAAIPAPGVESASAAERRADALPTPSGMHTAGEVDPPRDRRRRPPVAPSRTPPGRPRIPAQDGVDLGIGVDLVESLVQLARLCRSIGSSRCSMAVSRPLSSIEVGTTQRLPDQPVTRRSAPCATCSPFTVRHAALDLRRIRTAARSGTPDLGPSRFAARRRRLRLFPDSPPARARWREGATLRRFAGWPTTRRRPPR